MSPAVIAPRGKKHESAETRQRKNAALARNERSADGLAEATFRGAKLQRAELEDERGGVKALENKLLAEKTQLAKERAATAQTRALMLQKCHEADERVRKATENAMAETQASSHDYTTIAPRSTRAFLHIPRVSFAPFVAPCLDESPTAFVQMLDFCYSESISTRPLSVCVSPT